LLDVELQLSFSDDDVFHKALYIAVLRGLVLRKYGFIVLSNSQRCKVRRQIYAYAKKSLSTTAVRRKFINDNEIS
jgi:hypothetical protein